MNIVEALRKDELRSMKVRWVVGAVGINQNSGTTNFGEMVEEEIKRRLRKGTGGAKRLGGIERSQGKGKVKAGSIQCHRFMYLLNVAIRRSLVTLLARVVSGE